MKRLLLSQNVLILLIKEPLNQHPILDNFNNMRLPTMCSILHQVVTDKYLEVTSDDTLCVIRPKYFWAVQAQCGLQRRGTWGTLYLIIMKYPTATVTHLGFRGTCACLKENSTLKPTQKMLIRSQKTLSGSLLSTRENNLELYIAIWRKLPLFFLCYKLS